MTAEELIENIDWSELRNQKRTLLNVITMDEVSPKQTEDLEGIIILIDTLQDYACDQLKIPSTHVFDFEDEEQNEKLKDGDVLFPVEEENKSAVLKTLSNVDWTSEEKIVVKSVINRFGSNEHPYCDEQSFSYFTEKYLIEILSELNEEGSGFSEEGLKVLKQVKNKLDIL